MNLEWLMSWIYDSYGQTNSKPPQRITEEMPEGCPQVESEFLKGKSCDFKKSEIFLHDFG